MNAAPPTPPSPPVLTPLPPIQSTVAVGLAAGLPSRVFVFDGPSGGLKFVIPEAFEGYLGGISVATGEVNGDRVADVASLVVVVDGFSGGMQRAFLAFEGLLGGVRVASGDIDGDGNADILAGTTTGRGIVRGFSAVTGGDLFAPLLAFDGLAGVYLASGDVDGDGKADIVTDAGSGLPIVRVLRGTDRAELSQYLAFSPATMSGSVPAVVPFNLSSGVRVGVTDSDGDGDLEVVSGVGPSVNRRSRCSCTRRTTRGW